MPPPKKQNHNHGLGKALMKHRAKSQVADRERQLHTTEIYDNKPISVTQETDLENFLNTAALAGTEFTAERQNISILSSSAAASDSYLLTPSQQAKLEAQHHVHRNLLQVPRRPKWTPDTSQAELERSERDAFLSWRKSLATLSDERSLLLTPFERNLEVWRQLWRVIERSKLIVQIVDGRNPLRFRCEDLDRYVDELGGGRRKLLLINKSDLLSEYQRQVWADYLEREGIAFAFFSAVEAVKLQDAAAGEAHGANDWEESGSTGEPSDHSSAVDHNLVENQDKVGDDADKDGDEENVDLNDPPTSSLEKVTISINAGDSPTDSKHIDEATFSEPLTATPQSSYATDSPPETCSKSRTKILTVDELEFLFLRHGHPTPSPGSSEKLVVGLVGYPNVGKSSTINALVGAKKVSVSATPGKTKHFQTIHLSDTVLLCDCPGLVFPQFASTKAELVCDGVLSIDQMRDHMGPVSLVVRRIPQAVLEATYGLELAEQEGAAPTASTLLSAYAVARGFSTGGGGQGRPDEARAARPILKDYLSAKLLFCHPPPLPDLEPEAFNEAGLRATQPVEQRKRAPTNRVPLTSDTYIRPTVAAKAEALDERFFKTVKMHGAAPVPEDRFVVKGRTARLDAPNRLRLVPTAVERVNGKEKSKKHFKGKGAGRVKMRSGKGYDEF